MLKKKTLVTDLGYYLAEGAIASGAAGIAVGFTRFDSGGHGQVFLGKIDENGEILRAFSVLATDGQERRDLKLLATPTGFVAAWTEARPSNLRATLMAYLDGDLNPLTPPGVITVADDDRVHHSPGLGRIGDDLLVCYESHVPQQDAVINCRLARPDGNLKQASVSSKVGLSLRQPQIVADDDRFFVFWTGVTTGMEEVHARLFHRDGTAATEPQTLSEPGVRSWSPAVVRLGRTIFAGRYRYVPITIYFASFLFQCEEP